MRFQKGLYDRAQRLLSEFMMDMVQLSFRVSNNIQNAIYYQWHERHNLFIMIGAQYLQACTNSQPSFLSADVASKRCSVGTRT